MFTQRLRWRFNIVLVPAVAAALAAMVIVDYRHEVDALMSAHAMHVVPVGGTAVRAPVAAPLTPRAVARRALGFHAAAGAALLVLLVAVVNATLRGAVLRPLERMARRIEDLKRGHWRDAPVEVVSGEIGEVLDGFRDLGLAIDALVAHSLQAERLATVALMGRRLALRIDPAVGRIVTAAGELQAGAAPDAQHPLDEIRGAAAEIAGTLQMLDRPFHPSPTP